VLVHDPLDAAAWNQRLIDDPVIPRDFAACMALAVRIFGGRTAYGAIPEGLLHPGLHAKAIDPEQTSMTTLLLALLEGLRNPSLTPEQVAELDAKIADTIPPLPKSYDTQHFHLQYTTDDIDPRNNSLLLNVQTVGAFLESAWDKFDNTFFRTPYVAPNSFANQIDVLLYYVDGTYGFTSPASGITLNSIYLASKPNMRAETPPHELFHRLEFAFGYGRRFGASGSDWFVEGMAQWAGLWTTGDIVTASHRVTDMFTAPATSVFSRSYDSAPLWVFLEGQRIGNNPNFFAPLNFLNSYTVDGNAKKAFALVVMDAFKGVPQDNLDWYLNCFYLNSVNNRWKSVGVNENHTGAVQYPLIKNYDDAQVVAPFPALAGTGLVAGVAVQSFDGSLPQAAAAIYKFTYGTNINGKPVIITITGKNSATFFMSNLLMKNDGTVVQSRPAAMAASETVRFEFSVDPSQWDYALAIVTYEHSSGGSGASGSFTIKSWCQAP
jgi:hypothetical protein